MQRESDESKERFSKKPGDVLSQWWTIGRLLKDKRRAPSHDAVYWVIINSRDRNTGICRASMRFIEQALDGSISSRGTIKKAVHDLTEWGYIKPLPRRRRNEATKFEIPWVISSRGLIRQTTETRGLEHQTTSSLAQQNAGGLAHQNESYEHPDGPTGGDVRNEVSPPAADGLSASARDEGFEDVWKAYGKHGNKSASRKAWAALDFTVYDYGPEHIIERAASWTATAKPGQLRKTLEKWLEEEKFDQADRSVDAKSKAKKPKPTQQESAPPSPANDNEPIRKTVVATKGDLLTDDEGNTCINLSVVAPDQVGSDDALGELISICCESADARQQERGQKELGRLTCALGLYQVEDVGELLHQPFAFTKKESGNYEFWTAESEDKNAVSQIS